MVWVRCMEGFRLRQNTGPKHSTKTSQEAIMLHTFRGPGRGPWFLLLGPKLEAVLENPSTGAS